MLYYYFVFFWLNFLTAQNIITKSGSFGVDHNLKTIVSHIKNLNSLKLNNITNIKLNTTFKTKLPTNQ